ncbi:MAG: hypothetical protein JNM90_24445, partial [Burkholderiales bacterium]|nr:hypothetical protein [Burkholderiales bacterium]
GLKNRTLVASLVAAAGLAAAFLAGLPQDAWDAWKARREFSELVGDPVKYEACYAAGFKGADCGRWQLRAQPNPEYWPYPDAPRIKWPEEPRERTYKPGMNRVEYFQALCKAEAGEFIYKTVKSEGIYMIRPRMEESEERMRDRYGVEDPYGHGQGDVWSAGAGIPGGMLVGPIEHSRLSTPFFRFAEAPNLPVSINTVNRELYHESLFSVPTSADRFLSISSLGRKLKDFRMTYSQALASEVGYLWRGIRRIYDREFGIAGGELAVVSLKTNEILGIRRGFVLAQQASGGLLTWSRGAACPHYSETSELGKVRRRDKDIDYLMLFLPNVAVPEQKKLAD